MSAITNSSPPERPMTAVSSGGITQRTCHRDQRTVAGAVSVVVVELFEAVQIDHGDDDVSDLVATLL